MTTTITTQTPIRHTRRRTVLSVALVAVLALGAGAAAGRLTSSDSSTSPRTTAAANVDVKALWDQLASMPASERDVVVAGLSHDVRTRLQAIGEEIAVAAEHH